MQAVAVPAKIVADNAMEVLDSLKQSEPSGAQPLALDLAPLTEFDSSALSMLLQLLRERAGSVAAAGEAPPAEQANGRGLILLNPPEKLQELAELYGVADMLFATVAVASDPTTEGKGPA